MIKEYIEKISSGENLTLRESFNVMTHIMNGECNNSLIAGLLLALRTKKETPEEVAGFVMAMREKSVKIKSYNPDTIDVCGTGGDGSNTFNISTASAFVVAGIGIHVAKHGNRSISSKSGSADVLTHLGININLSPSNAEEALNEIGITFLFAPLYHPAMKFAAEVRRELGMKTIFNILGPLTNPANTKKQIVGVFNDNTALLMAEASKYLDMERVLFLCTDDCLDEVSLTAPTNIYEHNSGCDTKNYYIDSATFGFNPVDIRILQSDSTEKNAEMILSVLKNKTKGDIFNVIVANAAVAIHTAGYSDNLLVCKAAAEESIFSGNAYCKLMALKSFGEKHQ